MGEARFAARALRLALALCALGSVVADVAARAGTPESSPASARLGSAKPRWQVGYYGGTTSQQAPILVRVTTTSTKAPRASVTYHLGESCSGGRIFAANGSTRRLPVRRGAFSTTTRGLAVRGTFAAGGAVSGTVQITTIVNDGTTCSSGSVSWSAGYVGKKAPPPPPTARDGHYAGTTSQGEQLQFDVVQGGRYVSGLSTPVDESCPSGPAWYANLPLGAASILGGTFSIGLSLTDAGGSSSTVSFGGRFDGNGGASGTFRVATSGGGLGTSCSSGDVSWSAHLQ